ALRDGHDPQDPAGAPPLLDEREPGLILPDEGPQVPDEQVAGDAVVDGVVLEQHARLADGLPVVVVEVDAIPGGGEQTHPGAPARARRGRRTPPRGRRAVLGEREPHGAGGAAGGHEERRGDGAPPGRNGDRPPVLAAVPAPAPGPPPAKMNKRKSTPLNSSH